MCLTAGDFADLTGRLASLPPPLVAWRCFSKAATTCEPCGRRLAACAARLVGAAYRPEPASSGGPGWRTSPTTGPSSTIGTAQHDIRGQANRGRSRRL